MKIIKVIVSELPRCCAGCGFECGLLCQATGERLKSVTKNQLPINCPLELEQIEETCDNCKFWDSLERKPNGARCINEKTNDWSSCDKWEAKE